MQAFLLYGGVSAFFCLQCNVFSFFKNSLYKIPYLFSFYCWAFVYVINNYT